MNKNGIGGKSMKKKLKLSFPTSNLDLTPWLDKSKFVEADLKSTHEGMTYELFATVVHRGSQ